MLRRLGGALYVRRWLVLTLALALAIAAGVYGSSVGAYLSSDSSSGHDTPSQQAATILSNQLSMSRVDVIVFFQSATLNVNDPGYQVAVNQALAPLQYDANIANLTTFYTSNDVGLVSRDHHETFATVRFKNLKDNTAAYNQLRATVHSSTLHVSLGGSVAFDKQFAEQTDADLAKMEEISFPAVLIALVFVFGGLAAAFLPLVVGGVAILGALSLLRLLSGTLAISTYAINIVTLLGLGLAIDYALFIITRFREELAPDATDVRGALQRTVATAGRTVLFSGLTVSLSLLSLTLFPLATLRSLGIGSICAVLMAMLAALIVLPAILAVLGPRINALSVPRLMRRFVREPDILVAEMPATPTPQLVTRYTLPALVIIVGLIIVLSMPSLGFMTALVLAVIIGGGLGGWFSLIAGVLAAGGALLMQHIVAGMPNVTPQLSAIAAIVGLGLALDYSLLYLARFRVALARDERDVLGAIKAAYWATLWPIGISACLIGTALLIIAALATTTLHALALATLVALLIALAVALVALPIVLAMVRPWIGALSFFQLAHGLVMTQQRRAAAHAASGQAPEGTWYRLSQSVMQYPLPIIVGVGALLILLGTPVLQAQFAAPDGRALPPSKSARYVFDHLNADFAQQRGSQQVIAVLTPGDATNPANMAKLSTYVSAMRALPQVTDVTSIAPSINGAPQSAAELRAITAQLAHGNATQITVTVATTDNSAQAQQVVHALRAITPPTGFTAYVGGTTAAQIDLFDIIGSHLWQALAVIILSTLILLFLMTGSLVVPLKAIALNVLSLSATFGAIVFIFQQGHFQQQLGFTPLGSVDPSQLVIVFAIAFGLSMDYEVFLLSRIKEQYDLTKDNRYAVASGLRRTGRLITSAALLLAVVLLATSTSEIIFVKEIGLGLAIAILIDASLVRTLLVPATMRLLGNANWWPNLQVISDGEAPAPTSKPIPTQATPQVIKPAYIARSALILRRDIVMAGARQNRKTVRRNKSPFRSKRHPFIAPAGLLEALDPQQLERRARNVALRRRVRLATSPIEKPPQFRSK